MIFYIFIISSSLKFTYNILIIMQECKNDLKKINIEYEFFFYLPVNTPLQGIGTGIGHICRYAIIYLYCSNCHCR